MIGGEKNSQLKHLLEGAVPEIPAAGKWSRVEVRVRHLRRRRRFLRTGSALLALAVVVPAGLWVRTEIADPGQKVVITDPRGVASGVPVLNDVEQKVEISVFLKDSASSTDIDAMQKEILAMPEVKDSQFVSKEEALARLKQDLKDQQDILKDLISNPLPASFEISLKDPELASGVAKRFEGRPIVDEVRYASPQTTVTAFGQAQPTGSTLATGVTSTTTTLHAEELKWGETATVEGGTVTVDAPVVDPAAKSSQPGFIAVYSLVTMTNTGKTPISYSGRDFSLEGRHSGSTGITGIDVQGAAGGQPSLETGTLAPGQTVRGTVSFNLYQNDEPVLVWLLVPWSKQIRLNWR